MSDNDIAYYLPEEGPSQFGTTYYGTAAKCPRRFYHRYVAHTPPDPGSDSGTPGTRRGRLVHLGLMAHYLRLRARQQGGNPNAFPPPGVAMREAAREGGQEYQDELPASLAAVDGYLLSYGRTDRVRVVFVEEVLEVTVGYTPSGAPVVYNPRVDLGLLDENGGLHFPDHKSTTRPGGRTYDAYERSRQMIGLDYLGRSVVESGIVRGATHFAGVILNILCALPPPPPGADTRRIKNRPDRRKLDVGDAARAEFAGELVMIATEIEERKKLQETMGIRAWRKLDSDDGCEGKYNNPCPYWSQCLGRRRGQ